MPPPPKPPDPVSLVDSLEPEALRARLRDLENQSRAVKVLLRAAVAREKRRALPAPVPGGPDRAA
jgi:hypothetical protein